MHALQMSYSKYYNLRHKHSGAVWQGNYKAKHIDNDAYCIHLMHYIHFNPVKHGIMRKIEEWPYSSFLDLMEMRKGTMVNKTSLPLEDRYSEMYKHTDTDQFTQKIHQYVFAEE